MSAADDYIDNLIDNIVGWNYSNNSKRKQQTKSKTMTQRLQAGDLVRKRYGTRVIRVVSSDSGDYFYGQYVHSGTSSGRLHLRDVVRVEDATIETEQGYDKMKGKLFQTKDGRFGVGLAVNSKGEYVLEMKGTGELEAFDKKAIEVVMPFTFAVRYSTGDQEYQYLGKPGTVVVGDLLLATNSQHKNGGISIGRVTAVNTKSEKATKFFEGVKILTQPMEIE